MLKTTTSLRLAAIAIVAITLSACATTAQVEDITYRLDATEAKANAALLQSEKNEIRIDELNQKVDRMYQKVMTK